MNDTKLKIDEGFVALGLIGVLKNIFKMSMSKTIDGNVWKIK